MDMDMDMSMSMWEAGEWRDKGAEADEETRDIFCCEE